jgi:DNA-binding PadR family transcriptional regulator
VDSVPALPADLPLPEAVVVALLVECDRHGFALAQLLSSRGDLGRAYRVAPPAVYRAVGRLVTARLVETAGVEPGEAGPVRTLLRPTAEGRAWVARWLTEPVVHVRDLRTAFLVKLVLLERAGADRSALVAAQREVVAAIVARRVAPPGALDPADDVVALWRRASAESALHFLDRVAAHDAAGRRA